METRKRPFLLATCATLASLILAGPAAAQLGTSRAAFDQRPAVELVQFRDFFRSPFDSWGGQPYRNNYDTYSPFYPRPQQPVEAIKPPPPRKVETQPTETVVVIGDSLAEWLAYGLEETFADTPEVGIVRKIRPYSGLVRYDVRPDSPDWSQAVKEILATDKPSAIVVMLGTNDRLPLRERVVPHTDPPAPPKAQGATPATGTDPATPGGTEKEQQPAAAAATTEAQRKPPPPPPPPVNYEFHTDRWGELYSKRIDDMITALKAKGVPILWVGLPALRGAKSTTDMSYLDELYRARADKAGIIYVDIWDGFVDEQGRYTQQGPDFEGQTRRLRTYDGVNFTKYGAEKLAHYVERDLRRILTSRAVPVALPGPEEPAKSAPAGAKPAIGPVVPLGTISAGEAGELLGAANRPAPKEPDPVATRVLSRGDAIVAPPGRADDFSWPRADASANASPDASPAAAPPAPSAPAKGAAAKGAPGKSDAGKSGSNQPDANKPDANKPDAKKPADTKADTANPQAANPQAAATAAPNAAPPRLNRPVLDGAPRPPLPLGSSAR